MPGLFWRLRNNRLQFRESSIKGMVRGATSFEDVTNVFAATGHTGVGIISLLANEALPRASCFYTASPSGNRLCAQRARKYRVIRNISSIPAVVAIPTTGESCSRASGNKSEAPIYKKAPAKNANSHGSSGSPNRKGSAVAAPNIGAIASAINQRNARLTGFPCASTTVTVLRPSLKS